MDKVFMIILNLIMAKNYWLIKKWNKSAFFFGHFLQDN